MVFLVPRAIQRIRLCVIGFVCFAVGAGVLLASILQVVGAGRKTPARVAKHNATVILLTIRHWPARSRPCSVATYSVPSRPSMIPRAIELTRFCLIGFICFAISMGVLAGLCELGHVHYLVAFIASFLVGNVLGYLLNARYTFALAPRLDRAGLSRYMFVNAGLLAVNSMLLKLLVETGHMWYLAATVILAVSNIPISFLMHRFVSYRITRSATADAGVPIGAEGPAEV
jgi:putative flippase GtrA